MLPLLVSLLLQGTSVLALPVRVLVEEKPLAVARIPLVKQRKKCFRINVVS